MRKHGTRSFDPAIRHVFVCMSAVGVLQVFAIMADRLVRTTDASLADRMLVLVLLAWPLVAMVAVVRGVVA